MGKTKGKRSYKKKRGYRRSGWTVNKPTTFALNPVPQKMFTRMKYGDVFNVNIASGTTASRVFSCNGLYDPDITGTGHQPRGFDQLMALYNHYVVVGSKIRIQGIATTNVNGSLMCNLSVLAASTASGGAGDSDLLERPNGVNKLIGEPGGPGLLLSVGNKYSAKKYHGVKNVLDNDELQGTASANPAEQAYYHFSVSNMGGTDTVTINCTAQIEYILALREPKDPAES